MKLKPDDKEAITKWLGNAVARCGVSAAGTLVGNCLRRAQSKLDSTPIQAGFTRTPFSLEAILRLYGLY